MSDSHPDAGSSVGSRQKAGGSLKQSGDCDQAERYRRLCLHTVTTKPWPIETAVERYSRAGIGGITIWRDALSGRSPESVGRHVRDAGLSIVSLCRGGFFASADRNERERALNDNRAAIREAQGLGAPLVVLVCGADPRQSLVESRKQIVEGIGALAPFARECGVKLGIEPLHPMYADTRSAIVTLRQAREACEAVGAANVGVVVDVYHVWWDQDIDIELQKLGADRIFAYHICDWRVPTERMLTDRGIMGDGCIPLESIGSSVRNAGFVGFEEVEIFSTRLWAEDQDDVLARILAAWEPARRHNTKE
ncbi:MAG: sugar phosphate isomerase/epimerase family protein [Spirochaetales bacterium]